MPLHNTMKLILIDSDYYPPQSSIDRLGRDLAALADRSTDSELGTAVSKTASEVQQITLQRWQNDYYGMQVQLLEAAGLVLDRCIYLDDTSDLRQDDPGGSGGMAPDQTLSG